MYLKAVSFLLLGILGISINDTIIKFLSDAYALHQLVFIRAIIGLLIIVPPILVRQGVVALRTTRPGIHALRGLLIVLANLTFFAGLASLPLAEASAVIFVSPVLITIFSHYFLGEQIGVWRWSAVVIGLIGMICVVQPFGVRPELLSCGRLPPLFVMRDLRLQPDSWGEPRALRASPSIPPDRFWW